MDNKDREAKKSDISDLFGFKMFGIDFGRFIESSLGPIDPKSLQDPSNMGQLKKQVEELQKKLRESQKQYETKYGDTMKVDYDIRSSFLGGTDECRIKSGDFFENVKGNKNMARRTTRSAAGQYKGENKIREPLVDMIEGDEETKIIAEMPGVKADDIEISLLQNKLIINTSPAATSKYHTEVTLPSEKYEISEKLYVNGILSIRLKKTL